MFSFDVGLNNGAFSFRSECVTSEHFVVYNFFRGAIKIAKSRSKNKHVKELK